MSKSCQEKQWKSTSAEGTGLEHKSVLSHSRALGEVRGPGPGAREMTVDFQVFSPPRRHVFINTRNASKRHSPSTFLFLSFLWASIHHPPIRGVAQWGPASSSVWHENTICSVSYCIHHCSMRELWETSTLSKNVTGREIMNWIPSIVNLSISLSLWWSSAE